MVSPSSVDFSYQMKVLLFLSDTVARSGRHTHAPNLFEPFGVHPRLTYLIHK